MNFKAFFEANPQIKHTSQKQKDLEWFVGFVEGDGSWDVYKGIGCFRVEQKEAKVLYKIKKILGFGEVYKTNRGA